MSKKDDYFKKPSGKILTHKRKLLNRVIPDDFTRYDFSILGFDMYDAENVKPV